MAETKPQRCRWESTWHSRFILFRLHMLAELDDSMPKLKPFGGHSSLGAAPPNFPLSTLATGRILSEAAPSNPREFFAGHGRSRSAVDQAGVGPDSSRVDAATRAGQPRLY